MRHLPHKQLVLATLAHSFGRGSSHPVRAALWRLLGLACAATLLGILMARNVQALPLVPVAHSYLFIFGAAISTQIAVAIALAIALGIIRGGKHEIFVQLLFTWPLSERTRWTLYMLPSLILAGLAVLLVSWPLGLVLSRLGLEWPLIGIGFIVGYISAFGLVRGLPPTLTKFLPLWIAGIGWLEYVLLGYINNLSLQLSARYVAGIALAALLLILGALFAYGYRSLRTELLATFLVKPTALTLPPRLWYMAKLCRRPTLQLSLAVAFIISLIIAYAAVKRQLTDPHIITLSGAFLAASLATELRSVVRRYNPAEITALKGTRQFIAIYTLTALACGCAIAPLIVAAMLLPYHWSDVRLLHAVLQIILGVAAGMFAGALLVPEGRDISGQFTAGIIVLVILFALPPLGNASSFETTQQNALYLLLCTLLIYSTYHIEYKRNPYYWR